MTERSRGELWSDLLRSSQLITENRSLSLPCPAHPVLLLFLLKGRGDRPVSVRNHLEHKMEVTHTIDSTILSLEIYNKEIIQK